MKSSRAGHTKARKANAKWTTPESHPLGEVVHDLNENDVVMGRGTNICNLPGNINYRRICWQFKARYLESNRVEKQSIARQVLDQIASLDPPGRIVATSEEDPDTYFLVNEHRAIEKTCQQLREKKAKDPDGGTRFVRQVLAPSARSVARSCSHLGKRKESSIDWEATIDDGAKYLDKPVIVKKKPKAADSKKNATVRRHDGKGKRNKSSVASCPDISKGGAAKKQLIVKSSFKPSKKVAAKKKTTNNKPHKSMARKKEAPAKKANPTFVKPNLIARRSLRLAITQSIQDDHQFPVTKDPVEPLAVAKVMPVKQPRKKFLSSPAKDEETPSVYTSPSVYDSPIPKKKSPTTSNHYSPATTTKASPPPPPPPQPSFSPSAFMNHPEIPSGGVTLPFPPLQYKTSSASLMPDFLRGYSSMSFRPSQQQHPSDTMTTTSFDTDIEGIVEPPPLAAFSSGFSFGSLSTYKLATTTTTTPNTPPRQAPTPRGGGLFATGQEQVVLPPPSPTTLQPFNSLYLEGLPTTTTTNHYHGAVMYPGMFPK